MTEFNQREYQTVILAALLHDVEREGLDAKNYHF